VLFRSVNNESSEIIRMLNAEFDEFGDPTLDLYPTSLRSEIDEINRFVYDNVNNGVYLAGLAKSQEAYEQAFRNLFTAFDELETRLSRQRWLVGDHLPKPICGCSRHWSASIRSITCCSSVICAASPTTTIC
jgi:glutathionyl-hydroquinone reductase